MGSMPPPERDERATPAAPGSWRLRFRRPTLSGVVSAGFTVVMLAVASVLLVIPAVFRVLPMPPEADALTLCLPGIGPLHRFADDLSGMQEELTYVHESVHARQCRSFGATWFARMAATPQGRLQMEVQALCAEADVLRQRGADPVRLVDDTVETLALGYFLGGKVPRTEIAEAVDVTCGQRLTE